MKLFNYVLPTENIIGLKALVISDIHYFNKEDNKKLKEIMLELELHHYDVIFLVGDVIDSTSILKFDKESTNELLNFINFLGSVAPTYISYGNHDLGYLTKKGSNKNGYYWQEDEVTYYQKFLNIVSGYKNINVDENQTINFKEGYTINIINPSLKYVREKPDGDEVILKRELEKYEFLKRLNSDSINILLCHYPNAIFSLWQFGFLNNVNLSIAGHNHNGVTQFKFIPLEFLLNLIGLNNKGLITPGKSVLFKNTKYMRGKINFDDKSSLIINPAITTFSNCAGILKNFDGLFYEGASVIEYVPTKSLVKSLHK